MPLLPPPSGQHHGGHHQEQKKEKLAPLSVFLSLILMMFFIALGERATYDVNRLFNPTYNNCNPSRYLIISDRACQVEYSGLNTLLFHSYVTLPIFLLFLIVMLVFRKRRLPTWHEALYRVAGMMALVFGLQFLLEITFYLFQYYPLAAWYFAFTAGIIAVVSLVVHLERKRTQKRLAKHGGNPEHHAPEGHDDDGEDH